MTPEVVAALGGGVVVGIFSVGASVLDRWTSRRHERRSCLRAAVTELITAALVTPFGTDGEVAQRNAPGVLAELRTGFERMGAAHTTIALLGSPPLRTASNDVLAAASSSVQSITSNNGWWYQFTGRRERDRTAALSQLTDALDAMKTEAREFLS